MQRWGISKTVWRIKSWNSKDLKRGQGRPAITWRARVKRDKENLDLQIETAKNQNEWKKESMWTNIRINILVHDTDPNLVSHYSLIASWIEKSELWSVLGWFLNHFEWIANWKGKLTSGLCFTALIYLTLLCCNM